MNKKLSLFLKTINRIVIKVGTRVIDHEQTHFNLPVIESLVREIAALKQRGCEVILVSSGAVGAGLRALGVPKRPASLPLRQAYAAIGQGRLMKTYTDLFAQHNIITAQILLTRSDLDRRDSYLNARETLQHLLTIGVVPIINENDTVAVEELTFGDNDMLAALTAGEMEAQLLVLLTTVDGLYRAFDPVTKTGELIELLDDDIDGAMQCVNQTIDEFSMGGMKSKLGAARTAASSGTLTAIANGLRPGVLNELIQGQGRATWVLPSEKKLAARKYYLAHAKTLSGGKIIVDAGAANALLQGGKSLLASGVKQVVGVFHEKDLVQIINEAETEIARGLVNVSSGDLVQIQGRSSKDIQSSDDHYTSGVVIHRDNLVLTG